MENLFFSVPGHSPENDSIMQFLVSEGAVGDIDAILDQVISIEGKVVAQ